MSQQRESLLQYQPPTEVFAQESMGGSRQKNAQQMFDSKLAIDCTIYITDLRITNFYVSSRLIRNRRKKL